MSNGGCTCDCAQCVFPLAAYSLYDARYVQIANMPDEAYQYLDLFDYEAVLLLHFVGPNGSVIITDSSGSAHTVTANGNAAISTAEKKFLDSSLYLDGTGDYLSVLDSADWDWGVLPFTIDFQNRQDAAPVASQYFYNQFVDANNRIQFYYHQSAGNLRFTAVSGGVLLADYLYTWAPTPLTWEHIALVRHPLGLKLFINGQFVDWTTINTAMTAATVLPDLATGIQIGSGFAGYIDEYRISKNTARWDDDFPVPTLPYSYIRASIYEGSGGGGGGTGGPLQVDWQTTDGVDNNFPLSFAFSGTTVFNISVDKNSVMQEPGVDYTYAANIVTFTGPTIPAGWKLRFLYT